MKKNLKYIALAGWCLLTLSACYDDESTFATDTIEQLSIEVSGEETLYVGYLEQLDIVPEIARGKTVNPEGLEYLWEIGDEAKVESGEYIQLGTEAELHAVINNPIAATPYYLRLTVTDKQNSDLQAVQLWQVYVRSLFLDGIVVSDTQDQTTSDLTLIMNKDFTLNYSGEEKIIRNILTNANGAPYDRLMTSLTYSSQGYLWSSHTNLLWAVTGDGSCVRFNTQDFSENGNGEDGRIILYQPEGAKCLNFFKGQQSFFANTTHGIYSVQYVNASLFGWRDDAASVYTIDNNVVACSSNDGKPSAGAAWFDAEKGCFVSYEGPYGSPQYRTDYQANIFFDPQNMVGYTAVAGGMTFDGTIPAFLMKEKATGAYGIYTLTPYASAEGVYDDDWNWTETVPEVPASARMKYDIPAEGKTLLDQAVSIFFANKESIMYVATASGIYAINFAGSTAVVESTPKYSAPAGEQITLAKLYAQGAFYANEQEINDNVPEQPLNCKAVMVATQKSDTEGKLHVVPMTQLGTGNLDASKAMTYDGFGKILDVTTIGY